MKRDLGRIMSTDLGSSARARARCAAGDHGGVCLAESFDSRRRIWRRPAATCRSSSVLRRIVKHSPSSEGPLKIRLKMKGVHFTNGAATGSVGWLVGWLVVVVVGSPSTMTHHPPRTPEPGNRHGCFFGHAAAPSTVKVPTAEAERTLARGGAACPLVVPTHVVGSQPERSLVPARGCAACPLVVPTHVVGSQPERSLVPPGGAAFVPHVAGSQPERSLVSTGGAAFVDSQPGS